MLDIIHYLFNGGRFNRRSPTSFTSAALLLLLLLVYSLPEDVAGLRSLFGESRFGLITIIGLVVGLGLLAWLEYHLERSGRRELSADIRKNEAAFTAANRPGGWKQYYGLEDGNGNAADSVVADQTTRRAWQASYSTAGDRLAEVARQHRDEQQRLRRAADNREWLSRRSLRERKP